MTSELEVTAQGFSRLVQVTGGLGTARSVDESQGLPPQLHTVQQVESPHAQSDDDQ